MNKRITALLTALASVPLVAVTAIGTATPAAAADCPNQYPPGNAYGLRISPRYALINEDAIVTLSTRLVRGPQECGPGLRVGFWVRLQGEGRFYLARRTTTDNRGLVVRQFFPGDTDFRWFTDYNINAVTRGARSPWGLVQVR
jgi:hypothetical protein